MTTPIDLIARRRDRNVDIAAPEQVLLSHGGLRWQIARTLAAPNARDIGLATKLGLAS
jgi:hypothetical protein